MASIGRQTGQEEETVHAACLNQAAMRRCTTNAIANAIGNPIDTDAIGYRVGYRGQFFRDWLSRNTSDCLSLGLSGLKSDRLLAELSGRY